MGESCLHSGGNFTLQRIGCVSLLTVKDKGYLGIHFSPFIVSNPRSHDWSCSISVVYLFIYLFIFRKAYAFVMHLQIQTTVCTHLRMLTFPFNLRIQQALLCVCLSNRHCGCVILIKKNDKCGGKIKFEDI